MCQCGSDLGEFCCQVADVRTCTAGRAENGPWTIQPQGIAGWVRMPSHLGTFANALTSHTCPQSRISTSQRVRQQVHRHAARARHHTTMRESDSWPLQVAHLETSGACICLCFRCKHVQSCHRSSVFQRAPKLGMPALQQPRIEAGTCAGH